MNLHPSTTVAFSATTNANLNANANANVNSASQQGAQWSKADVLHAEEVYRKEKIRLLEEIEEAGGQKERAVHIHAEFLDPSDPSNEAWLIADDGDATDSDTTTVTKIVHFQRHGQGYHNLLGELMKDLGIKPQIASNDPTENPWIRPEIVDSPLTALGVEQCSQQRALGSKLNPQLVVVSPMLRAIQTAKLSFADHWTFDAGTDEKKSDPIPWIAHEGCREELGHLVCNRRRVRSEIAKDDPEIDLSLLTTEEDEVWMAPGNRREGSLSMVDRAYDFLAEFLVQRPEREIAVVGHSAWLFHMCNGVVDCRKRNADGTIGEEEDGELAKWFLTSEIRSMKMTFTLPKN